MQRRGEQCKHGRQPDISRRAAVPCAAALGGGHTRFCVPDQWHIAGLLDRLVQQWFAGDGHAHGAKQNAQRITVTREKIGARGQHQRAAASIAQWQKPVFEADSNPQFMNQPSVYLFTGRIDQRGFRRLGFGASKGVGGQVQAVAQHIRDPHCRVICTLGLLHQTTRRDKPLCLQHIPHRQGLCQPCCAVWRRCIGVGMAHGCV